VRAKIFDRRHLALGAFEERHLLVANGAAQRLVAQGVQVGQ
jgi:hypothetical protein